MIIGWEEEREKKGGEWSVHKREKEWIERKITGWAEERENGVGGGVSNCK